MDLREKRIAILTRWHRDLADDFTRALPRVLADLEAADREHAAPVIASFDGELGEGEMAALEEKFTAIVKPQQRRRAARKAGS